MTVFLGNQSQKDGLVEKITQLLPQRARIAAIQRLEQLICLLQHKGAQREQRLLAIPRHTLRGCATCA